ncbi:MAG: hypothetical protein HKN37_13770 [Rhodothermales bacterium]|nr:hypothetical protein [Rhodothermales bacterium]
MLKQQNRNALAVVACFLLLTGAAVSIAIATDEAAASTETEVQESSKPSASPALDGAKVYAWSCGTCHSERWPKERSDEEWDVIMTHMRVRANMTAAQTEAVLRYLKENN